MAERFRSKESFTQQQPQQYQYQQQQLNFEKPT